MNKDIKEEYRDFTRAIPSLIKEGYSPVTIADLMELELFNSSNKNLASKTVDAIVFNSVLDAKIIRNSKHLLEISEKSPYLHDEYYLSSENSVLILSDSEFEELVGEDVLYFTKERLSKFFGRNYSRLNRDFYDWNIEVHTFLARDKLRLQYYVEKTTLKAHKYSFELGSLDSVKVLGFYYAMNPSEANKLRPLGLSGVEGGFSIHAGTADGSILGIKK